MPRVPSRSLHGALRTLVTLWITATASLAALAAPDTPSPSPSLLPRTYFSRILEKELPYDLLPPPNFQPTATNRYPVLYWLPDRSLAPHPALPPNLVHTAIAQGILPPLFVVYVRYGADHLYTDAASGLAPAATTLLHELIPAVDQAFPTLANPRHRAIQGIGRGGFGALHLAFSRPAFFGSTASFLGSLPSAEAFASRPDLRPVFESTFGSQFDRAATNHPAFLAQARREQLRDKLGIRITVDSAPSRLPEHHALRDALRAARLEFEWSVSRDDLGDNPSVPEVQLIEGLEFMASWLGHSRDPDRDGPWSQPPTNLPPRLQHHVFYSELLERAVGYSLYLPPGNPPSPNTPWPVVYHLHGRDEDEVRHLDTTGYLDVAIRLGDAPRFAWVWLYGGRRSWFMDSADGRVPAQSVLLDELIPHIETRWNLGGAPHRRAVDGWGMGAFGALRFAAMPQQVFGAALLHNPLLPDLVSLPSRFPEAWMTVFNTDTRFFAGTEPFGLLQRHAPLLRSQIRFRIVAGERSPTLPDAQRLKDHLLSLGFNPEWEPVPAVSGTGPDLYRHTGLRDVQFLGRAVTRPDP